MNQMFDAMNVAAAKSAALMEAGIAQGIGPGEETLTDVNLIQLGQLIPSLRVTKYSKQVEAGNGADWEWWIGSAFEERWIKLRVQAKRSSHTGDRYEQLGHTPKGRVDKQYDTLIAQSLIEGAIPFHVFFNGWPENRFCFDGKYHDAIARHRRAARDGFLPSSAWDSRNWGCSIASTLTVKTIFENPTISDFPSSLLDKKQVKDKLYVPHYLIHSTPWSHLFCSSGPGRIPTVREVAQNLHQMQGNDWELTEDEFLEMTYPNPSPAAEEAAYGKGRTFRKSITLEEEDRRRTRNIDRLQDFISSLESPSEEVLAELDRILEGQMEWGPGYRLLLELDPQRSFFFNSDYRG